MDFLDQGFLDAKPVKKKDVNMVKLKEAIKEFIRKNYKLPIVRRNFDK
jgi:hypothetical protein